VKENERGSKGSLIGKNVLMFTRKKTSKIKLSPGLKVTFLDKIKMKLLKDAEEFKTLQMLPNESD
jgi:hypothetical protein